MTGQPASDLKGWRDDDRIGRARYLASMKLAVGQQACIMHGRWRNTLHMEAHYLLWWRLAAARIKAGASTIHVRQMRSTQSLVTGYSTELALTVNA